MVAHVEENLSLLEGWRILLILGLTLVAGLGCYDKFLKDSDRFFGGC